VENISVRPTNIKGLDLILGGGLVDSALYMIEGMPGAGKTILSSQLAFEFARQGDNVLYITLIAESHGKLIRHLGKFAFFDSSLVSSKIQYLSAYKSLIDEGLQGLLEMLATAVEKYSPRLLIIDGFRSAREISQRDLDLAKFIHELNAFSTATGCTTLLLSPQTGNDPHPEHTLVDGLIELKRKQNGMRSLREIEVHKLRGANHLTGTHFFEINVKGIETYPRAEARWSELPKTVISLKERMQTGINRLDEILGGGLPTSSTTALMGSPGTGKTILGLKFLETGLLSGERGLYFGFYESPDRLLEKAESLGMKLSEAASNQSLQIIWNPPTEQHLDKLADQLINAIKALKAKRVFIDGMDGFRDAAIYPHRMPRFLAAITAKLRFLGVTVVYTEEVYTLTDDGNYPITELSAVVENIILLRHSEGEECIKKMLSVLKMRDSDFDSYYKELVISNQGITLLQNPKPGFSSNSIKGKTKANKKSSAKVRR
jgi:circadian clock protein KaiC